MNTKILSSNQLLEIHPIAHIFPMMSQSEFEELKNDISIHGLREPIWTYQEKIIDGRNRYKACIETGAAPIFREWDGKGTLLSFILSLNLHRRHLSTSQKAALAVELLPMLERDNEETRRQRISATRKGEISPKLEPSQKSSQQAGSIVGVGKSYVSEAKKIQQSFPEIFSRIKNGSLTLAQAKQLTFSKIIQEVSETKTPLSENTKMVPNLEPSYTFTSADKKRIQKFIERDKVTIEIAERIVHNDVIERYKRKMNSEARQNTTIKPLRFKPEERTALSELINIARENHLSLPKLINSAIKKYKK